jgi:hypothetical protein
VLDSEGATVTLRIPQIELTRLPWGHVRGVNLDPNLAAYIIERLQLRSGGEPCPLRRMPQVLAAPPGRVAIEWRVDCAQGRPREIRSVLLHEVAPGHLHFARVRAPGASPLERVLTTAEPGWRLESEQGDAADGSGGSSLWSYLVIGVEHIGTGPDHLAFVLALILIAARFGEVATVITGFTIAHSITLAVAENAFLLGGRPRSIPTLIVLGLGAMVLLSALGLGGIGCLTLAGMTLFTLCYFGLLGLAEQPARLRVAISFAFGLVHGFGFAGVLVEIALPRDRLVPALLGFNLGVEVGQLVLVAALWPLLRDLARVRDGRPHRLLVEVGSAILCCVGLFWFLTRAFE